MANCPATFATATMDQIGEQTPETEFVTDLLYLFSISVLFVQPVIICAPPSDTSDIISGVYS